LLASVIANYSMNKVEGEILYIWARERYILVITKFFLLTMEL
jgi:hypothetical protein